MDFLYGVGRLTLSSVLRLRDALLLPADDSRCSDEPIKVVATLVQLRFLESEKYRSAIPLRYKP